jgi:DNA-binding MarR family transcriptional regulator
VARPRTQVAFLLTQLGSVAADQFGERAAALELTRPESGILRLVARTPGQSQRTLAARLGSPPSRLVALIDGLQGRGLVERRRSIEDRRNHELYLTDAGQDLLRRLGEAAAEHEATVTAPLSPEERTELERLLQRLADHHGLTPEVHPGYRRI